MPGFDVNLGGAARTTAHETPSVGVHRDQQAFHSQMGEEIDRSVSPLQESETGFHSQMGEEIDRSVSPLQESRTGSHSQMGEEIDRSVSPLQESRTETSSPPPTLEETEQFFQELQAEDRQAASMPKVSHALPQRSASTPEIHAPVPIRPSTPVRANTEPFASHGPDLFPSAHEIEAASSRSSRPSTLVELTSGQVVRKPVPEPRPTLPPRQGSELAPGLGHQALPTGHDQELSPSVQELEATGNRSALQRLGQAMHAHPRTTAGVLGGAAVATAVGITVPSVYAGTHHGKGTGGTVSGQTPATTPTLSPALSPTPSTMTLPKFTETIPTGSGLTTTIQTPATQMSVIPNLMPKDV